MGTARGRLPRGFEHLLRKEGPLRGKGVCVPCRRGLVDAEMLRSVENSEARHVWYFGHWRGSLLQKELLAGQESSVPPLQDPSLVDSMLRAVDGRAVGFVVSCRQRGRPRDQKSSSSPTLPKGKRSLLCFVLYSQVRQPLWQSWVSRCMMCMKGRDFGGTYL